MKSSWFSSRLTPAKGSSVLWKPLATMIQSLSENYINPRLERLSAKKSIFNMDTEDIEKRVTELGSFFAIRSSNADSVPILLQQRLDEIHFKGTDRPIIQTFYREFNGVPMSWEPLYAPANTTAFPYASVLITKGSIQTAKDRVGETFLTSRGSLVLPLNELMANWKGANYDIDTDNPLPAQIVAAALVKFNQVGKPLLPCHLVYDGYILKVTANIDEYIDNISSVFFTVEDIFNVSAINETITITISSSQIITATKGEEITYPYKRHDADKADTNIFDYLGHPTILHTFMAIDGKPYQPTWQLPVFNYDSESLDQNIIDEMPLEKGFIVSMDITSKQPIKGTWQLAPFNYDSDALDENIIDDLPTVYKRPTIAEVDMVKEVDSTWDDISVGDSEPLDGVILDS